VNDSSLLYQVKLMCSYCTKHKDVDEVPDPYYGGAAGFEKVCGLYCQITSRDAQILFYSELAKLWINLQNLLQ